MKPKHPPPWLFGITIIPYGVVGSIQSLIPNLAQKHHIDFDQIGVYVSLLFLPPALQVLYAPLIDIGPQRRHWLIIMALLSAACVMGAFLMPIPEHINAFVALAFVAQTLTGLIGACNGGLLALTMPDEKRGAAAAWYNVGNLSAAGVATTVGIYMNEHDFDPLVIGGTFAAMLVIPSFAILWVDEPRREQKRTAREVFGHTWGDVKSVLWSKSGLSGFALCLSPVGTAALLNYYSGMGDAYHASGDMVAFVSGGASAVVTAIGSLAGGYLCDRFNRRALYLLSGGLTAACGIVMALSPHTELTYAVGATAYNLIAGFCFAAFTATVLETIGAGGKAAGTQYALFLSAGNAAIGYVGLVDTRFNKSYGVDGMIASDATLNLLGVAILGYAFWRLGSFGKRRSFSRLDLGPGDDKHDAAL
jgi:PAT family beta-lactamase induction signal transducer AmpG